MKGVKRPAPGEAESNGKKAAGRGKGHESVEKEEESEVEQEAVQDSKSRRGGGGKEADADDADVDAKNGSQDEEGKGGAPAEGEKDGAADSSQSKRPKEVRNTTRIRVCPPFFKYPSFSFPLGAKTGHVQQQYEYQSTRYAACGTASQCMTYLILTRAAVDHDAEYLWHLAWFCTIDRRQAKQ